MNLCGGYKSKVYDPIHSSTDISYATDLFCRKFEVCGNYDTEVPKRLGYAKKWYRYFVSGEPITPVGPGSGGDVVAMAAQCMKELNQKSWSYEYGGTPSLSAIATYNNGKIDCSGYVSWVLYRLGIITSKLSSSGFASNPMGWMKVTNKTDIKAGDIIVYSGHVDICAADVTNASSVTKYNAGSTNGIRNAPTTTGWHSGFKFALRKP